MQSPAGELPVGGRSAQHAWNEAQLSLIFGPLLPPVIRFLSPSPLRGKKRVASGILDW
jgi:hypothetical protein